MEPTVWSCLTWIQENKAIFTVFLFLKEWEGRGGDSCGGLEGIWIEEGMYRGDRLPKSMGEDRELDEKVPEPLV